MTTKVEIPEGFVLEGINKETGEVLFKSAESVKQEKKDEELDKRMRLELVRELQATNPHLIIGGSVGLYLRGIRLERFEKGDDVDLDVILPFYQAISDKSTSTSDTLPSGCDFDEQVSINGVKIDIRIDPHQKYELITYKDNTYKVGDLYKTLAAKIDYAQKRGGEKHRKDILELLFKKS